MRDGNQFQRHGLIPEVEEADEGPSGPLAADVAIDIEGFFAATEPKFVDEGWQAVDMVWVGVGQDHPS